MATFGYAGKILRVDLSSGSTKCVPTMDYADRFLGGRGIAAKIYWDEVLPEVNAFAAENRLICHRPAGWDPCVERLAVAGLREVSHHHPAAVLLRQSGREMGGRTEVCRLRCHRGSRQIGHASLSLPSR